MTERELQALEQAAGFSLPLGESDADSDGYGNRSAQRICALELEINSVAKMLKLAMLNQNQLAVGKLLTDYERLSAALILCIS